MKVEARIHAVALAALGALLLGAAPPARAVTPTPAGLCSGVPAWTDCCNCTYTKDQKVTYGSPSSRYHVVQTFTNTCGAGWTPNVVASLWALDGACGAVTPTPTRTPTPTATPTRTPTPTRTNTPTSTSRSTATRTSTPIFCPTETPPPTTAVTDLAAAVGDKKVTLTWTLRVNRYSVFRATAMNGPYTQLASGIGGASPVSYVDAAVTNGTTYYYTVQGFVDWSYGVPPCPVHSGTLATPWSNMVAAVPQVPPPPSPGVPIASAAVSKTNVALGSTVTVTGTTNMGIPQWRVTVVDLATGLEQDQTNPIFTPARPAAQANPAFTLTAARVGAVRFNMGVSGEIQDPACGNCFVFKNAAASSVSVSAGAPQAQGSWGLLTCSGTLQGSAFLSWSPIAGASSYSVKRSGNAAGPWTDYTTTTGTGLTIGDPTKSGYYYVTAMMGATAGPPSNVAQALFFSTCP